MEFLASFRHFYYSVTPKNFKSYIFFLLKFVLLPQSIKNHYLCFSFKVVIFIGQYCILVFNALILFFFLKQKKIVIFE